MFYSIAATGPAAGPDSRTGSTSFSNADIGAMREALRTAMTIIDRVPSSDADIDRDAARNRIACAIIDIATDGERDADRLAELAVAKVLDHH